MNIKPFGVEIWMNKYENDCEFNLAETCVESLTIEQLLEIADARETAFSDILAMKMDYGAIEGSDRLRKNICGLYENLSPENIIITHGTISANALVFETLVNPGDRVISVMPTYQQHYSIPESYGADVKILRLRPENQFLPDIAELERLACASTRLIAINNPNNPTGSLMDLALLEKIAEIASRSNAYVLSDEVYRGIAQSEQNCKSMADIYEKGISTSGMSKSFSLAGLRVGWVAGPVSLIENISIRRDYNTISVGKLNDYLACLALESKQKILQRNIDLIKINLQLLDNWVQSEPLISYIRPKSGTTALLKYELDIPSIQFCEDLLEKTGVMLTPGAAMDMEGWLRIGYANNTNILRQGLAKLSAYLSRY